tara:strand:- start:288 stop:944 length:657 start_codon:yes stop_codon:yes gene_type:complete
MNTELFTRTTEILNEEQNKPIPHNVILDSDLTRNDLAIYLAIQYSTNFSGTLRDVKSDKIETISGVLQPNQGKSLDILETKGYIIRMASDNCYAYAIPEKEYDEKFLILSLSSMATMRNDVKEYVSKLKCLVLANSNSTIPSYKMCKEYVSRYEYIQLKKIEQAYESAIEMYDSIHVEYPKMPSKTLSQVRVQRATQTKEDALESLRIDLEIDALLSQ